MNDWFLRLPPEIQARAYRSESEFAWPREDAVRVIEALETHFVVIGVEVWLATIPEPTIPSPFIYHWTPGSSAPSNAADFVRNFEWGEADTYHRNSEPYFNLTVVPLQS